MLVLVIVSVVLWKREEQFGGQSADEGSIGRPCTPVALKERDENITQGERRSRGQTESCVEMGFI
jgi:hypothetical protein